MTKPPSIDDSPAAPATSIAPGVRSKSELDDLVAKATSKYAVKDYSSAAELYSRATELQAELNGEMSAENADLLYSYGRCLYHVAVQNSDVLGSKVAGREEQQGTKERVTKEQKLEAKEGKVVKADVGKGLSELKEEMEEKAKDGVLLAGGSARGPHGEAVVGTMASSADPKPAEDNTSEIPEEIKTEEQKAKSKASKSQPQQPSSSTSKTYFSITGDENWDESSDDELAGDGEVEAAPDEDPDDDFSNAFEVLDIARVLLERRLAELSVQSAQQTTEVDVRRIKERLADTRDLQAEISLEAERFADAATDLKVALEMKEEVLPQESSMIAEAHYKLSLALEFASIEPAIDPATGEQIPGTVGKMDQKMRDESAWHMERAIESCKKRIMIEEEALKKSEAGGGGESGNEKSKTEKKAKITRQSIDDVKDMVNDMEQRLKELRAPPVSVKEATTKPDPGELSGILGLLAGESADAQKAKLDEVMGKANDLSGLVKKRKPAAPGEKRKAEEDGHADGRTGGKKPKQ